MSFLGRVGYSKVTGEFSAAVYPWPPQLGVIGSTELAIKLAPPDNRDTIHCSVNRLVTCCSALIGSRVDLCDMGDYCSPVAPH